MERSLVAAAVQVIRREPRGEVRMGGWLPTTLAWSLLVLAVLVPIAGFLLWSRGQPYTWFEQLFRLPALWLARVWWRLQIHGEWPEHLRESGGAVIICNHRSSVDPFFIHPVAPRLVHWMVAREYCEHPAIRWFMKLAGVIPTNRSGMDTTATRTAIRLASQGGLIGLFPEGRLNRTTSLLLPGRPGAIMIALKAGVPIVPCFIQGSPTGRNVLAPFFRRARVELRVGRPVDISEFAGREHETEVLREVTLRCLQAVAALAGQPNYPVTLAGRRWTTKISDASAED